MDRRLTVAWLETVVVKPGKDSVTVKRMTIRAATPTDDEREG